MATKKTQQTVISADKYYTISAANGRVIEVADYNTENGAAIQLWDNMGAEWQQWKFNREGDGIYRVENRFTDKMLDLMQGGTVDGTWLHQWEGGNGSSQLWAVEFTNDGRVKLKSHMAAGKCVDVVGMSTENGARIQIWSDVDGENQIWTLNEVAEKKARAARKPAAKKAPVKKAETVKAEAPKAEAAAETKAVAAEAPKAEKAPAKRTCKRTAAPKAAAKVEAPKAEKAPAKKPAAKKASK